MDTTTTYPGLELENWMLEHDYSSVQQMRGSLDLSRCPDASSYERANYVHILQGWDEKAESSKGLKQKV